MKSFTNKQIRYLTQNFLKKVQEAKNLREVDKALEELLSLEAPLRLSRQSFFLKAGLGFSFSLLALLPLSLGISPKTSISCALLALLSFLYAFIYLCYYFFLSGGLKRLSQLFFDKNLFFSQKITIYPSIPCKPWKIYSERFTDFKRGFLKGRRSLGWVGEKGDGELKYQVYEFKYEQEREKRKQNLKSREWATESLIAQISRWGMIAPFFPYQGDLLMGHHPVRSLNVTPFPLTSPCLRSSRSFNIWKGREELPFLTSEILKQLVEESEGLTLLQIEVRENSLLISTASPLFQGKRHFSVGDGILFEKEIISVRYLPLLKKMERLLKILLES